MLGAREKSEERGCGAAQRGCGAARRVVVVLLIIAPTHFFFSQNRILFEHFYFSFQLMLLS